MILPGGKCRVWLATRPVDFRKGHAGLSLTVQTALGLDPYCGVVFVFRSKRSDRIKILVWDQTGLVFAIGLERMATRWLTLQASGGRR
ncbi:MAG: IS66 family insertion sequence element accessory protein TnpB, partial [Pseudomonadota bacterium]